MLISTVSSVATFILSGAVFGMLSNFGAKPNTADTISKEQFSVNVNNSKLGEHLNRKYTSGISCISLGSKGNNKIESASITRSNKLTFYYSYATLRKPSDRIQLKASLEKLSLNYIDIEFYGLGCAEQLAVTEYSPDNASEKGVTWSSTDEAVAVVDGNGGKIHAPQPGYTVTHDYGVGSYRSIRRIIE